MHASLLRSPVTEMLHFTIDPTGQYLLVANQRSDTITVFDIDSEMGTLAPNGHVAEVPSPVCLMFL
jgi:6-phosphogluconolactonase